MNTNSVDFCSRCVRNWRYRLLILIFQISIFVVILVFYRYFDVDLFVPRGKVITEEVYVLDQEEIVEQVINETAINNGSIPEENYNPLEETFTREYASTFKEVMSDGSLDCRPTCIKKDFFTGLFGRMYSERCKVRNKIKKDTDKVPLPAIYNRIIRPIDGFSSVCRYPVFTKYLPESDSLYVDCEVGDTLEIYVIEDNIPGWSKYDLHFLTDPKSPRLQTSVYCDVGGKCVVTNEVKKHVEPSIYTFEDSNEMTVKLNNSGTLIADCGKGRVNVVLAAKLEEGIEKDLEKKLEEKKYRIPPPDVLLIVTDTTNRFGFAEGLVKTRKIFDEMRKDENSGVQIFDFMLFNSVDRKTTGNLPPLLSGCPVYNGKTYNKPFPKNHVYTGLFTDLRKHGYFTLFTGKGDKIGFQTVRSDKPWYRQYDSYASRMSMGFHYGQGVPDTYTGEGSRTKSKYKYGSSNLADHCIAGKTPVIKYTENIINQAKYRDNFSPHIPHFLFIHELENHNPGYQGGQVMDDSLEMLLKELDMSKTIMIVVGDHGYWAGSVANNQYFSSSFYNPPGIMMFPEYLLTNELFANLKHNEKWIITVFDIHRTIKELPLFLEHGKYFEPLEEKWEPGGVAPGSVNLITERLSHYRSCPDANIPSSMCTCDPMKSRKATEAEISVLKNEFLEFIENTVPHEFCWVLEDWMLDVEGLILGEDDFHFECKVHLIFDGDRFVAKEKFLWKIVGDVGKGEDGGKFVFGDLDFRVVSRTSIYDLELCGDSITEKYVKEVCLCKEGNDLSRPGIIS